MPMRLLLVDDDARNLALLEAYLQPLGCELTRASGGREALAAIDAIKPDLVLLDVAMPELDGIDVLMHLRAQEGIHVPVILVTAHSEREHRLRGVEAGADDFLEKPIDRSILLARVRTLLRMRESACEVADRNQALERLQREQRELTAFIVHDLKSPIAVAQMNIDYAREHVAAMPHVEEALAESAQAVHRLQMMVNDMLIVSRLEQAQLPLQREPLGLAALLREVTTAHFRESAEKSIAVSVKADDGLRYQGDRAILRRVFENIFENAIRYTPRAGKIAVCATGNDDVEVVVANTGPRIPMDMQSSIFDKFVQGDVLTSARGNIGLGLYFCKRALAAHGGDILVRETKDFPTAFVVRLPAS
jgi:two-component system, sensor histidine kinase and response regulator